jgi:hypothetical protein
LTIPSINLLPNNAPFDILNAMRMILTSIPDSLYVAFAVCIAVMLLGKKLGTR